MGESKQGSRGGTVGHTACNYTHLRMTPACTGDGSYSAPLRCLVMTSEDGSWDRVGAIYFQKCLSSWKLSEAPLLRLDGKDNHTVYAYNAATFKSQGNTRPQTASNVCFRVSETVHTDAHKHAMAHTHAPNTRANSRGHAS